MPSTRFTFHSFFVLAHSPVTSAYPDACGYHKPPGHNTFIHSDPRRTGMFGTFLFPVLESHCASIVASARPQHAPCGLPFDHHMLCPCNERVTSALLTDCSSPGPLIHNILLGGSLHFRRVSLIARPGQGLTFPSKHSLLVQEVLSVYKLQEVISFVTPLPRRTTTPPARERTACLFTANKHGARCQHKQLAEP